jgi:hypothetical protein
MKEIGIFQENATCFDRAYAENILNNFSHLDYIKKETSSRNETCRKRFRNWRKN